MEAEEQLPGGAEDGAGGADERPEVPVRGADLPPGEGAPGAAGAAPRAAGRAPGVHKQGTENPARQPWDSSQAISAQPGLRCHRALLLEIQVGSRKGSELNLNFLPLSEFPVPTSRRFCHSL